MASADDIREYVREQIAGYKYPRVVWIRESLPKGPTGKILRRGAPAVVGVPAEISPVVGYRGQCSLGGAPREFFQSVY